MFQSATSQLKSNFVQYSLTGDPKAKTAYETAQASLDALFASEPPEEEQQPKKKYDDAKSILGIPSSSLLLSGSSQTWKYWIIGGLVVAIGFLAS
jgi:hypothetical protein